MSRLDIFYFSDQVFDETVLFARSLKFPSVVFGILISFIFLLFSDSRYISESVFIPILYLFDIMHECLSFFSSLEHVSRP